MRSAGHWAIGQGSFATGSYNKGESVDITTPEAQKEMKEGTDALARLWKIRPKCVWKHPTVPRTAVQVFAIDYDQRLLLLHRGPNIRSARNVWSFPTGLHDIGERIHEAAARELMEEVGLQARRAELISVYENIAGDSDAIEQYHWVMLIVCCIVDDVRKAVNIESDKHDDMQYVDMYSLGKESFFNTYKFHDSLRDHMKYYHRNILKDMERMLST